MKSTFNTMCTNTASYLSPGETNAPTADHQFIRSKLSTQSKFMLGISLKFTHISTSSCDSSPLIPVSGNAICNRRQGSAIVEVDADAAAEIRGGGALRDGSEPGPDPPDSATEVSRRRRRRRPVGGTRQYWE